MWRQVLQTISMVFAVYAGVALNNSSSADASGMTVEKDISYGSDAKQRLDVYLPEKPNNAPLIVMIHGGAWASGSKSAKNVVDNKVRHWVPKGYIFVSLDYRLIPEANPLEQADDVSKALAYVQKMAGTWGGNSQKIVLMGHSSGAHLAALMSADPSIVTRQGAKPWLATIALDSGAYNVSRIMKNRRPALYEKAFGSDPDFWRQASPFFRLNGTVPPMLLVCSSLRRISCNQADAFATKAGNAVEVLPVALRHAPINAELGLDNGYTGNVDRFLNKLGLP